MVLFQQLQSKRQVWGRVDVRPVFFNGVMKVQTRNPAGPAQDAYTVPDGNTLTGFSKDRCQMTIYGLIRVFVVDDDVVTQP